MKGQRRRSGNKSRISVLVEMGTNTGHVMTLANSIIGVSVLAMPFCYKQCGIVLASLMLIISSIMSRLACYYLIKSSILARRRTFEFLAFHTFGPTGKLTVELSIIGFMLGTCVAFFVVMGDLGPAILGPIMNIENPSNIRASVLIALAALVVLPLGLLRNVDSLAAISAATIAFYICLVLKVMGEATTHLLAWDWLDKVHLWRPAGLLQCIPIFSMALSCQTQLFEIFDSIPNATLEKMNVIVRSAANLCTIMYMSMGFFGYVAFCTQPFSGNLMLSFTPTATSEVIKMGFVLSVAVSFPLVIFPCRASLHSLLFRRGIPPHHELLNVSNHIPETRFKFITLAIVTVSLIIGIMIPNIELVLGLVGSTIGVLICIIIPATLFLCLTTKNNNERLLAQVLFVMGLMIMVLGSYANLYATEEVISGNEPVQSKLPPIKPPELPVLNQLPLDSKNKVQSKDEALKDIKNVEQLAAALPKLIETPPPALVEKKADVRKEPPIPEAPVVKVVSEAPSGIKIEEPKSAPVEEVKIKEPPVVIKKPIEKKVEEVIHNDAIKKEDDEIKEVQKQEIEKKEEELIGKLQENEQKQQKLLEEQKKILQDIQIEKEKLVEENIQLNEIGKELPAKKPKEERLKIQNEVIEEGKKVKPVVLSDKTDIKNIALVELPKVLKTKVVDSKLKDTVDNIIKDDIVKKNMADGVPLPLAIQQVGPNIEAVKSARIVDNPANPNEGNADSKILRREILGETEVKEQREKRDLEEVISFDLKDSVKKMEIENFEKDKVGHPLQVIEEKTQVQAENINIGSKEVPITLGNKEDILQEVVKEEKTGSVFEKKMDDHNKYSPNGKETTDEQCLDNTKAANVKFSDQLKPMKNKIAEGKSELVESQAKTTVDVKSAKEIIKKEETTTESIIKAPAYLSNPGLVLQEKKLEPSLIENVINNVVKPMKRDLKSLDMAKQENKKENET